VSQESNASCYYSNDWLIPIAEEAKPIFSQFSQNTAIEVAAAVLKGAIRVRILSLGQLFSLLTTRNKWALGS